MESNKINDTCAPTYHVPGRVQCETCCATCDSPPFPDAHNQLDPVGIGHACETTSMYLGTFDSEYSAMEMAITKNPECKGYFMYHDVYGAYCCDNVEDGCTCGTNDVSLIYFFYSYLHTYIHENIYYT